MQKVITTYKSSWTEFALTVKFRESDVCKIKLMYLFVSLQEGDALSKSRLEVFLLY